jgi:hypothetical protein
MAGKIFAMKIPAWRSRNQRRADLSPLQRSYAHHDEGRSEWQLFKDEVVLIEPGRLEWFRRGKFEARNPKQIENFKSKTVRPDSPRAPESETASPWARSMEEQL